MEEVTADVGEINKITRISSGAWRGDWIAAISRQNCPCEFIAHLREHGCFMLLDVNLAHKYIKEISGSEPRFSGSLTAREGWNKGKEVNQHMLCWKMSRIGHGTYSCR